jgi:DNA repair protein SbcD/Mre11
MRILHTADWHVGKRLGRFDRLGEAESALAEVERVADEREADLLLVSGDVFDRPTPPIDALTVGLRWLLRLAAHRPVVAVAGNHDSPELFEALAPLLAPRGVHLVGSIKRPDQGGILGPDVLGVPARVACFPFLREGHVVDFMQDTGQWYRGYAERVARICAAYNQALVASTATGEVPVLMAHFLVNGVKMGGDGARGERELHMGAAYAATPQAIPAGPQYVALGHIHAPQPVPGAPVPAQYAGSLLPLDFGEAGEQKRVVLVDASPGRLAVAESIPLACPRPLIHVQGTWEQVEARADELRESYLDLTVDTSAVDVTLGQRARETFPLLVNVRPKRREADAGAARETRRGRSLPDLYETYFRQEHADEEPPKELLDLFRDILEEADAVDATA